MTTCTISINNEDLASFMEEDIKRQGFGSRSSYFCDFLRKRYQEYQEKKDAKIEKQLDRAVAELEEALLKRDRSKDLTFEEALAQA